MAAIAGTAAADSPGDGQATIQAGITFASVDEQDLKLDYYPPTAKWNASESSPLIVWVHGGAWRRGDRGDVPIEGLRDRGYAIASVDYRLSPVARFPNQVLDIKRAIRFLHRRAQRFDFDPDRMIIAGASAGGHLAALVGVSHGVEELEPGATQPIDKTPTSARTESPRPAVIVSFYGASDLRSILDQTDDPDKREFRLQALRLLLGDHPGSVPELAKLASPVAHVTPDDPPLILLHGRKDIQMPYAQSLKLHGAYGRNDLRRVIFTLPSEGHGGEAFYTPEKMKQLDDMINRYLH